MRSKSPTLVSVIIPFFNEENILSKAIESVINQSYTNLELLLIDDHSTDTSNEICKRYIEKHQNICLYIPKKKGIGNARNLGIDKSRGEFIAFLDADDRFDPKMIETLVDRFYKYPKSDIIISKFNSFKDNTIKFKEKGWDSNQYQISGHTAVEMMYSGKLVYTVWAKLFRKSRIEHVLFPIDLWFEDRPFMLSVLLNSTEIILVDEVLLKNNIISNSVTRRTISEKRLVDLLSVFKIELSVIKGDKNAYSIRKLMVSHHLNAWLESLCLIHLDNEAIKDLKAIKRIYKEGLFEFGKQLKINKLKLTKKQFYFVKILNVHRILPWSIYEMAICYLFFRKRFNKVKSLKGLD